MRKIRTIALLVALTGSGTGPVAAQLPSTASAAATTSGILVIVPASGEVVQANDEAHASFMVEEQDQDKAMAAAQVNKKMKQGADIIRQADHQAILRTRGYYSYPVYAKEAAHAPQGKTRIPVAWRVGQTLEVKTPNLDGLPKTVAAAQSLLALNGLQFGLTNATRKNLDRRRIEATYLNLQERIGSIAVAMGRSPSEAVIETIDFDDTGAPAPDRPAPGTMLRGAAAMEAIRVDEPSFEPGETTLRMHLVAKVKFK